MEQKVILTSEEIDKILSLPTNYSTSKTGDKNGGSYSNPHIRNSYDTTVDNKFIEPLLLPHLLKYNIKSITGQVIMLKYNKGHFFKPHRDRFNHDPHTTRRIQTLIVQLSNPEDYTGGELIVRDEVADKTRGNMALFDSNELHECKTITSGTRYCLVTWLTADDYKKNVSLM